MNEHTFRRPLRAAVAARAAGSLAAAAALARAMEAARAGATAVAVATIAATVLASASARGAAEPLTLGAATQLALAQSHEVSAAAAALEGDLAAARLAGDVFRPEAGITTTPGFGRGLPVAIGGQPPAVVSIAVRQSLYNREESSKGLDARAAAANTRAAYQHARQQVARAVADLFGRCWSDQELLRQAEQRLAAYSAMAARAADLRGQGRATDLDVAQARLREAKSRLRRMEIAAARDTDLWELRQRLGLPGGAAVELPADPLAGAPDPHARRSAVVGALAPDAPTSGAADALAPDADRSAPMAAAAPTDPIDPADLADLRVALATDADLAAANRQVDLLSRARDQRQGLLAPVTVEADAQYARLSRANGIDQFYVKFREDDWSIALVMAVPLWTGGRLRDGLARTEANLERVRQEQHARLDQLAIDVHRAAAALSQAEAARSLAAQASAVAVEDLRIAQALAAEGRAQPDELDAKTAAIADAAEDEVKATAAILTARVQLLAVRGDLFDQLGIADPERDPEPARPAAAQAAAAP